MADVLSVAPCNMVDKYTKFLAWHLQIENIKNVLTKRNNSRSHSNTVLSLNGFGRTELTHPQIDLCKIYFFYS